MATFAQGAIPLDGGSRPEDPTDRLVDRNLATTTTTTTVANAPHYEQNAMTLRFEVPELEVDFVAYMHPAPLRALPIMYFGCAFLFLLTMLQEPGIGYEINFVCFTLAGIINLIANRVHKRNGALWALEVERQLLVIIIVLTILLEHWVQLQHVESCDVHDTTPIDHRKAFVEPHCRHAWTPIPTSGIVFATATQIILFPSVLGMSVFTVAVYSFLWVFRPPENMFVSVWLQVVYVAASLTFVCFVRYDQEQSHRSMFIAHRELQDQHRLLVARQRSLAEYCTLVLPRSLLRRVHLHGGNETITAVDRVEDGAALYVGIHECGVWFTQQQPLDAASAVVALHDMVRRVAVRFQVDVVGTMGDAILCAANVSQPLAMAAQKMCLIAAICVHGKRERSAEDLLPPLRLAAHSGRVEGQFSGTHFVRYTVKGPCMAAVQAAVLECGPGDIAASEPIVAAAQLAPRLPGSADISTPGSSQISSLEGNSTSESDGSRHFTCQGVSFSLVSFKELVPSGYDWSSNDNSELSNELFDPSADVERLMAGLDDSMNAMRQQQYGRKSRPTNRKKECDGNTNPMARQVGDDTQEVTSDRLSSPNQSPGIVVFDPPTGDTGPYPRVEFSNGTGSGPRSGFSRSDEQLLHASSLSADRPRSTAPEESVSHLKGYLGRFDATEKVWCFFPKFVDETIEKAFVDQRIDELPEAASRTWFAYAAFLAVMVLLLIADFHGPNAIIGTCFLIVAVLLAIVMAALPRSVSRERMRRLFFPWSVLGVSMPLLVVYGCAISRPSAIGNDTKLFLLLGALIRSYCFASVRWQAVIVPIATFVGLLQYLLPGGLVRTNIVFVLMLVVVTVFAELEREKKYRENTRRAVEARLVVSQLQSLEWLREGLLRSVVPPEVFRLIRHRHETETVRATSRAFQSEGTVMVLQSGASDSPHIRALESLLVESKYLALASVLGDQAVVVGPVVTTGTRSRTKRQQETDLAIRETISVALQLESIAKDAVSTFDAGRQQRPAFSAIIDIDAVVHVTKLGDYAQYWALGVTVTRLLTLVAAADPATLGGLLVTDRVLALASELGLLPESVSQSSTGPLKLRGVGVVRLTRLETAAPSNPL